MSGRLEPRLARRRRDVRRTHQRRYRGLIAGGALIFLSFAGVILFVFTARELTDGQQAFEISLQRAELERATILVANDGSAITRRYPGTLNVADQVELEQVPEFLISAFIHAEDRRFWTHSGADWRARAKALWQNIRALRAVRGASTISEQSVRMLLDRPRSLWTRWLEGFDATTLERRWGKRDVLEFYLNQVPFAANRRGVVQASRYYFGRDLSTLSRHEMLALAVLPRAPSRLDLRRHPGAARGAIQRLAQALVRSGHIGGSEVERVLASELKLREMPLELDAWQFARFIYSSDAFRRRPEQSSTSATVRTTLDASLQTATNRYLRTHLQNLRGFGAKQAAALVVEHRSGAIRAWVNASLDRSNERIDAVLAPRQPGSTLKPFVYAEALELGLGAATRLRDEPLREGVGSGEHSYQNYSRRHYGAVSMRDALGNSLNIPAVRMLHRVGADPLLARLRELGVHALDKHPDFYGDGLALGNGEISLLELVRAYTTLANLGERRELTAIEAEQGRQLGRVYRPGTAAILADILSDPNARRLEFEAGGTLDLPLRTAIKTGTSSDYKDAWAIGFDHRHTVGIWMGNLDREAMQGLSGARGPALALRAIFAQLRQRFTDSGLRLPSSVQLERVCVDTGQWVSDMSPGSRQACAQWREEWRDLAAPVLAFDGANADQGRRANRPRIRHPSANLRLARDPRTPAHLQRYRFEISAPETVAQVVWLLDGEAFATTRDPSVLWPLQVGEHRLQAKVVLAGREQVIATEAVRFFVR